jgi:hypothetical protein
VHKHCPGVPIVLIGTKSDLRVKVCMGRGSNKRGERQFFGKLFGKLFVKLFVKLFAMVPLKLGAMN